MRPLVFLLCLLFTSISYGQLFNQIKQVKELRHRTLAVVIKDNQPNITRRYQHRSQYEPTLEAYQDAVNRYNRGIQNAVEQHWDKQQKVVYITETEWQAFAKRPDKKDYVFLFHELSDYYITDEFDAYINPYPSKLVLKLGGKLLRLHEVNLPFLYPSEGDLSFAVQQIQYFIHYSLDNGKTNQFNLIGAQVSRNKTLLKDKILLIDQDALHWKLDANNISKYYPYPFELASRSYIDSVILSKSDNYVYTQVIPFLKEVNSGGDDDSSVEPYELRYYYLIIDAASGELCVHSKYTFFTLESDWRLMRKRHLKYFANRIKN